MRRRIGRARDEVEVAPQDDRVPASRTGRARPAKCGRAGRLRRPRWPRRPRGRAGPRSRCRVAKGGTSRAATGRSSRLHLAQVGAQGGALEGPPRPRGPAPEPPRGRGRPRGERLVQVRFQHARRAVLGGAAWGRPRARRVRGRKRLGRRRAEDEGEAGGLRLRRLVPGSGQGAWEGEEVGEPGQHQGPHDGGGVVVQLEPGPCVLRTTASAAAWRTMSASMTRVPRT